MDFNKQRAVNSRPTFKPLNTQNMLYVRTPLHGNEYKVCDEITDEVVAIFFNQQDAIDYINWKTNKQEIF